MRREPESGRENGRGRIMAGLMVEEVKYLILKIIRDQLYLNTHKNDEHFFIDLI